MNVVDTIEFENQYLFSEMFKYKNDGYNNRYIHSNNLSNSLKPLRGKYCVYFLTDQKKILYIGKTINPYERIIFHRHNKDFTDYVIGFCLCKYDMDKIESDLINRYKPFYNLSGKIKFRELKKVTLWLTKNQYDKLEVESNKLNIKKIEYLQQIINKKIKP